MVEEYKQSSLLFESQMSNQTDDLVKIWRDIWKLNNRDAYLKLTSLTTDALLKDKFGVFIRFVDIFLPQINATKGYIRLQIDYI